MSPRFLVFSSLVICLAASASGQVGQARPFNPADWGPAYTSGMEQGPAEVELAKAMHQAESFLRGKSISPWYAKRACAVAALPGSMVVEVEFALLADQSGQARGVVRVNPKDGHCRWLGLQRSRPSDWAAPVTLAGVPNLHQVAPGLYRSAQPTPAGMKNLAGLGVKTVINLRTFNSDRNKTDATGLRRIELSVKPWHIEDKDVIRVLRLVNDPARGPYLIHCQHGADRTGLMCAMYRVVVQGWSKEAAIAELVAGGFGYHPLWHNIIDYIRRADVEKIRAAINH